MSEKRDDGERVGRIRDQYEKVRPLYEAYVASTVHLVNALIEAEGIEVSRVEGRAKTLLSLANKSRRHAGYFTLNDVSDLAGVRIVCFYQEDVQSVVEMLSREFAVEEAELHRGAGGADAFGYSSFHLVSSNTAARSGLAEYKSYADFRVEFQVRTVLQDAWAVISHKLDYKTEGEVPGATRRTLFRAAALLETSDELFNQFKNEVLDLREAYSVEITEDRAQGIELNRDALQAMWDVIDKGRIIELATRAGFRVYDGPEFEIEAEQFDRLLTTATAAGISTLGRVASIVEGIEGEEDLLSSIADDATLAGFQPYAVPADVVSLVIATKYPGALRDLRKTGFRDEISEAVRNAGVRFADEAGAGDGFDRTSVADRG